MGSVCSAPDHDPDRASRRIEKSLRHHGQVSDEDELERISGVRSNRRLKMATEQTDKNKDRDECAVDKERNGSAEAGGAGEESTDNPNAPPASPSGNGESSYSPTNRPRGFSSPLPAHECPTTSPASSPKSSKSKSMIRPNESTVGSLPSQQSREKQGIARITSSIQDTFFKPAQTDHNEQIVSDLQHHAGPKMVRNKWGALKANLHTVVHAEKKKDSEGNSIGERTSEDSKEVDPSVMVQRPRASFSDSRFAKNVSGKRGSAGVAQAQRMKHARQMAMNRAASLRTRMPMDPSAGRQRSVVKLQQSRQGSVR